MKRTRLTHTDLVFTLGTGLLLVLAVLLAMSGRAHADGPPWYVNGSWDGWTTGVLMYDDGTHGDATAGDGIYAAQIHVTSAGKYEFKANDAGADWYPTSGNAWFYANSSDYTATLTFDTNTYADGWEPVRYIVNADDVHTDWVAIGDWQGWNNVNPATAMSLVGGYYELTTYVATAGPHQYKAVITGTWDAIGPDGGGNSGGRSVNAFTSLFTTTFPNQQVTFYTDPDTARIKVWAPVAINEFVFNHIGTDTNEFVELLGLASTDYSAFTLLEIEGDSNKGVIDEVIPVGTTDANGYWTTGFLNNALENGTVSLLLVENFTGTLGDDLDTDDDGVLDVTPWDTIVDDIAVNDGGSGDLTYAAVILAGGFDHSSYTPGGASRIPNGTDTDSVGDWMRNDYDGAGLPGFTGSPDSGEAYNTPQAANLAVPLINEFVFNHIGADTSEFVEVFGSAGSDYSALTLLEIEGDTSRGVIDEVIPVGTADANGYWTTGFLNNALENGSVSLLLVENFTGTLGDDLDTDDDGVLDVTPWDIVVDDIAVNDGGSGDLTYAAVTLTVGFDGDPFTPGGASRIPNATDTDSVGDWMRNDYDGEGLPGFTGTPDFGEAYNTPQAENAAVEPVSDLAVVKEGSEFILPGDDLIYTIRVQNFSNISATNVVLTDSLPISTTYVSDDSGVTPSNPSTGVYVWNLGDIQDGITYTLQLTLTSDASVTAHVLTNQVDISSDLAADDPSNNTDTWDTYLPVSIYDIQYTTDPSGDSPYRDQQVTTEGTVVANLGSYVFLQDGPGAWNGIVLYNPAGSLTVGDYIRVTGTVVEYYNLTEFASGADTTVISSGNPLPAFEVLATGDVAQEQYEGVLVRVENATVTDEDLGYGEWEIDDGSGGIRVDDMGSYAYPPGDGDVLDFVQGPLLYYYDFKIEPRDDGDIGFSELDITKDAVAQVDPGDTFTYTLTVENKLGFDLNGLVITDTVPTSATLAYPLDGGVDMGGVVSWSVVSLANGNSVSVRFVVTATGDLGEVIVNDDYAASASNYVTLTFGTPVNTFIGALRIFHIQGDGDISPYLGQMATVQGVVVADFQASTELDGFFMQDATGDGDPLTSDGIFVYDPGGTDVNEGEWIELSGTVDEYSNLTQLDNVSAITVISSANTIVPTQMPLPEQTDGDLERVEGMLVTIPHTMTVEQNYFQGRYGQVTLASGGRLYQPTNVYAPGSAEAIALADENARRLLILDDGSSDQNPNPIPYIGEGNTLRAGDVVSANLTGVLDYGPIDSSSPPATDYRLHPTAAISITRVNARTDTPDDVGGRLQVASFNVLNYFTTFGSRGADNQAEFDRQRTKIITAMLAIDADIFGLMEIENNGYAATGAIQNLVNGLNDVAGTGTYAFIDPGVSQIGTDQIAVGLIYKPGSVTPVGSAAILDSTFDPAYIDTLNRPALAQTFAENATGEKFTAVVNHLKSKGSACDDVGDPDTGDGQGNCNLTRTSAMTVEIAWLATDPTGSGDPDFLIIGDLNSYAMEDPITAAKDAGYTDLLQQFVGAGAYSYIFDGQSGYLDHSLSNPSLTPQVTGATEWHINADEPAVIDYNTEYKPQDLYSPTAYRSSDHDPVIVGLNLVNQTGLTVTKSVTPMVDVSPGDTVTYTILIANDGDADATGVVITDTLPPEVDFGGWVYEGSASVPGPTDGEIVWGPWTIESGTTIAYIFTATLKTGTIYFGIPVTNTVDFVSSNAGSGSYEAVFNSKEAKLIYLPIVAHND